MEAGGSRVCWEMQEQRHEVDQGFSVPRIVDTRKKEYKTESEIMKKVKPVVKKKIVAVVYKWRDGKLYR